MVFSPLCCWRMQNQPEIRRIFKVNPSSSSSSSSSSSRGSEEARLGGALRGGASFGVSALLEHEKMKQQQLLEWGRQDPLRAKQLLRQQQQLQMEKERQRGVQHLPFLQPQKAIDYPRLFGFTDLLLLPFDVEGDLDLLQDQQQQQQQQQRGSGAAAAGGGAAGGKGDSGGYKSSKDLSGSYCSSDWLYVGGEPLLHASDVESLHLLLCGFIGVSPFFAAPLNPETHENALYTGRHYSAAFLIEAALKDKIRGADADHHKPWDAEVGSSNSSSNSSSSSSSEWKSCAYTPHSSITPNAWGPTLKTFCFSSLSSFYKYKYNYLLHLSTH